MSIYHYANRKNEPVGPKSLNELRFLASTGEIADDTPVISEGESTWSTWGAVRASRRDVGTANEVNTAAAADKIIGVAKAMNFGSALFALLMILVELFVMPARILMRAIKDLSDWGMDRRLPSSTSDMPVVTYHCIVLRPVVHLLFTLFVLGSGVVLLFAHAYFRPSLWVVLFGFPALAYFGQIIVSLIFENIGLIVRAANNLATIAKNTESEK